MNQRIKCNKCHGPMYRADIITITCTVCGNNVYNDPPPKAQRKGGVNEVVWYKGRSPSLQGTTIQVQVQSVEHGGPQSIQLSAQCHWCGDRTHGRTQRLSKASRAKGDTSRRNDGVEGYVKMECTEGHRFTVLTYHNGELRWE